MIRTAIISDLGRIVTGNTPPRNQPELYGDYTPFIKATDISENEKHTYLPEEGYSESGHKKYIRSLIPKGSTCVVTIGSIGKKMTMAHCDCFINQAMNAIIPNEHFDNEYVYYAVKNVIGNLKALDSGTASGRENVSKSAFSKMEVTITDDIISQRKIGSILAAYDDLIENNQKQIKLLEEAAQRLYKEWFVDLRFPGHEHTKIVDGVPEGWEKRTVSNVSSVLRRGISPKYNNQADFMVINQKCIRHTVVTFDEARKQEKRFTKEMSLQDGDVVICSTGAGTLGRVGQIFGDYPRTTFDSHVTLVRANPYIGAQYLFHFLKSRQEYLMGMGKGSTNQLELGRDTLKDLGILIPTKEIRKGFEMLTQPVHDKIGVVNSQIDYLVQARDRLLPKLMSGEVEV